MLAGHFGLAAIVKSREPRVAPVVVDVEHATALMWDFYFSCFLRLKIACLPAAWALDMAA